MGRGGDAERCKSLTRDETFVSEASFLGPPKISDFWGEQRPWSPADLIGVPRELRSNGERRSDGALYFGMPKSFSEVRDDEGYQPLRPKCRMRSTAVPSRNAQSPQEQIVRSEAKIRMVQRIFGIYK